ncbi:MAG: maleylpyruvate isomerase N-terminal domain-containing protein [Actinomycetota bacterium]
MTARVELTDREAAAWVEFRAAVDAIPEDRRESPVLTDGWSVKDVLWHVAFWWDNLTPTYEAIRAGVTLPEGDTDATNARVLDEGRERSLGEVETGLERSRTTMLGAWTGAPDDPHADEVFVWETIEHYEEHLPWLLAVLD